MSTHQPRILQLRYYANASSQVVSVIMAPPENPGINDFSLVDNAKSDGSLRAVFKELSAQHTWSEAVGKLYGWGNNGLVKQSDRGNLLGTPIGPAIRLDPTHLPNPTATPTIPPTASVTPTRSWLFQEDNIRIAQADPAFHDLGTGSMAVEVLVRMNSGSFAYPSEQFIVGKGLNYGGFNLFYRFYNGESPASHFLWQVGNETSYQQVENLTSLAHSTWYYVVGVYDANQGKVLLWVNDALASQSVSQGFAPKWGTYDMRLGAPSDADGHYLDGDIGGYVALLKIAPSKHTRRRQT
jgi:hypothetical protein